MEGEARPPQVSGGKLRYWSIPVAALLTLGIWRGQEEGERLTSYPDPASGGAPWTICRGITGPAVRPGLTLTVEQCNQLENEYVAKASARIGGYLRVPLSFEEWVAWGDFSYTTGTKQFKDSTALHLLNEGKRAEACAQITRFRFAAGQDCSAPGNRRCSGLWKRRLRERHYCEMGV